MQRILLTLLTCIAIFYNAFTQDEWDIGVSYVIWVADQTGKVHKNQPVNAIVGYKDKNGNVLYRESHAGVTNELGNLSIKVGKGQPIEGTLSIDVFKNIVLLFYNLIVIIDGSTEMISGENPVCATPRAHVAGCALTALNAWAFGGILWGGFIVPIGGFLCPPPEYEYSFPSVRHDLSRGGAMDFVTTPVSSLVRARTAPEVDPSGDEIAYLNIGAGLGKPMYCGPDPSYIYAMHAIRMAAIGNLIYGADVLLDNYDADHATYAVGARNNNASGAGLFASSPNIGVVAIGAGGGQFQSVSTNSGYGVFGIGTQPAAPGQFIYGVAGTDGGNSENYAGYFNGMTYFSTNPTIGSDGRLKKEIRSESNSLSLIQQLRPTTYHFIEDTPFSLPENLQHGFIAQELEQVLPELVTDVVHPTTFDPELMTRSSTVSYKGINYNGLISILTAGIQELDNKVIAQQNEILLLQQTITQLSERLANLEN